MWQVTEFDEHGAEAVVSEHPTFDAACDAADAAAQRSGRQCGVSQGIPTEDPDVWDWELVETTG